MDTNKQHTRRRTLQALGAAGIPSLAGCADALEGNQETSDSSGNGTSEPTEPPTEESEGTEQQDQDTGEPENEGLTWDTVLEPHNKYKRKRADQELIQKAVNGEKPGQDYGVLFDHPEYGPVTLTGDTTEVAYGANYSHGKEYFDIDHFESLDPSNFDDFLDILNDAVTLKVHELANGSAKGGVSGMNGEYSFTAEELIENVFPDVNIETLPTGNDGHGFLYAFSEDHGGILVDSTDDRVGRIGENVLEGREGYDWIGYKGLIQDIRKYPKRAGKARSAVLGFYIPGDRDIGMDPELIVDIYEDIQDDADQIFDKVQPMVAATSYLRGYTDELDSNTTTVIDGTLDEMPSRSELESFEAYKEELKPHLVTLEEYQENQS